MYIVMNSFLRLMNKHLMHRLLLLFPLRASPGDCSYFESRKRVIDDTSRDKKQQELRQVAPWLPSFTPEAAAAALKVHNTLC